MAEHRNWTLLDMVHSKLSYMDLPILLWVYAILTAIYLLHQVLTKFVSTTLYKIWIGRPPSLKHVRIWSCSIYVKKLKIEKLKPRSNKGRFVGYRKDSLGYYIYFLANPRVMVAKHIIFLEETFI